MLHVCRWERMRHEGMVEKSLSHSNRWKLIDNSIQYVNKDVVISVNCFK